MRSTLASGLPARVRHRIAKPLIARSVARMSPQPVSEVFGFDRGTPVDRHYIEAFLSAHAGLIAGRVLEVADSTYTKRFGRAVTSSDVLHAGPGNPEATVVGDLQSPDTLTEETFDCILLVQTLQFVADPAAALATCRRALVPGGSVLATVPGISQVSRYDMDRWGDYWRFTDRGAEALFARAFAPGDVTVEAHGNAAAACAFLQGLAAEELPRRTLDARHRDYPLIVTVVATRR
jgi:SAM-dependent methyltransferase